MSRNIIEITAFLEALPVDTTMERSALISAAGSAGTDTILVAGGPDAGPLTLIPAPEPLFSQEDMPGCHVTVEYGPEFSVRAVNADGEAERYRTAGDFRHFWAHRLGSMKECTVTSPAAILRRVRLVFCCLDGGLDRLDGAARGCSGCVMVVPGDAGCLSDGDTALCGRLASVWCLAGRTSMLLRLRSPFTNDLLALMAEQLLGRGKLAVFSCGEGIPDLLTDAAGLEAAVLDILDRETGSIPDKVLANALIRVRDKLTRAGVEAAAQEAKTEKLLQQCRQAAGAFQAMCLTEKYSLGTLLTQEDQDRLRKEIHDLFAVLQARFPQMVEEVADQIPTAKEDLKNLAGDYLGALIDAFMDDLLDQVTRELLVPRTQERFLSVCQRFRRLAQDHGLDPGEMESQAEADFLRMCEVNVGDFHPELSQIAATLLTGAVRFALIRFLDDVGYLIAEEIEDWLSRTVMELADHLMPARMYAKSLCKYSLTYLQTLEENLNLQLEETVIPRLIHVLQKEFDTMTGVYAKQLLMKTEAAEEELRAVSRRRLVLEERLGVLDGYLPDSPGV